MDSPLARSTNILSTPASVSADSWRGAFLAPRCYSYASQLHSDLSRSVTQYSKSLSSACQLMAAWTFLLRRLPGRVLTGKDVLFCKGPMRR